MRRLLLMILVSGRSSVRGESGHYQGYQSSHCLRSSGDVRGSASSVLHMSDFRRAISLESPPFSELKRMLSIQYARSKIVSAHSKLQGMLSPSVIFESSGGHGVYTQRSIKRTLSEGSMMHIRPIVTSVHFSKRLRSGMICSHGLRSRNDMRCMPQKILKKPKNAMKQQNLE